MKKVLDLDVTYTEEVKAILSKSKLPTDDLDLSTQWFIGVLSDKKLIGIGALELYGSSALLRSMAVIYAGQNKGLGTNLVSGLLDLARKNNVSELFLLTETAEKFFAKNGFNKINRSEVHKPLPFHCRLYDFGLELSACIKKVHLHFTFLRPVHWFLNVQKLYQTGIWE